MIRIALIAKVGDGLCMAIRTTIGEAMLVDCGSTDGRWNLSGSKYAFDGLCRIANLLSTPRTLFLSHIHIDHYNGLIHADRRGSSHLFSPQDIRQVISPGIPSFSRAREFLFALLTMNLRLLGDETGVAQVRTVLGIAALRSQ